MRFYFILVFCWFSFSVIGQPKIEKRAIANKHIEQLRNGVLLVALDSKYGEIYILQKYLKQQMADELKKEQSIRNKEIYLAFREEFEFSEVYFYYKSYNRYLLDGQYDKVVFYNNKLEIDYDFEPTAQAFYIAAFEDDSKMGLHTYDNKMQALIKPFPNYESERKLIFFKKDAFEVVSSWNERLHNYLAQYEYTKKLNR